MIRVSVLGAGGRMGSEVIRALLASEDFSLAGALARHGAKVIGQDAGKLAGQGNCGVAVTDDLASALANADAAIDFTLPDATVFNISGCEAAGCALVIGTTGHDQAAHKQLVEHDWKVPAVLAPNMSIGVNLLYGLAGIAARTLPDYDAEIVEVHHCFKKDSPSGTALKLGEAVAAARGHDFESVGKSGRGPGDGPRTKNEIGISAVRAGDVIGEHTLILAGSGESLELRHVARDRKGFASGALIAARWVRDQRPGLYGMSDVLGI